MHHKINACIKYQNSKNEVWGKGKRVELMKNLLNFEPPNKEGKDSPR